MLTLTTPRTDDPLAGVIAPTSSGANPAAGTVSDLLRVHAQMAASLPVSAEHAAGTPGLNDLHTPADYANYIDARTNAWQSAKNAGQAPGGQP